MTPSRRVGLAVKRAFDVAGAVTGMVLLAPVIAWTAVAIAATMGRPIFFRQVRPGLRGRPTLIWKFRTMRSPRPGEVWFDSDAARVTRLGAFLRARSLDELPELWNVLRGEMSLVGPRPLLMEYLDHYTPEERRRHDMRPGIDRLGRRQRSPHGPLRGPPASGRVVRGPLEPLAGCPDHRDDARPGSAPGSRRRHPGRWRDRLPGAVPGRAAAQRPGPEGRRS